MMNASSPQGVFAPTKLIDEFCAELAKWISAAAALEPVNDHWTQEQARLLLPGMAALVDATGDIEEAITRHGVTTLLDSNGEELRRFAQAESDMPPYADGQIDNARCALELLGRQRPATRCRCASEIEDDIWKATALIGLADWIAAARQRTERLQEIVDTDRDLDALLKEAVFPVNDGGWGSEEQSGLRVLYAEVAECLSTIGKQAARHSDRDEIAESHHA